MAMERIEFGDSITGLVIDGVEGTPFVGATLRLTREQGVVVEVPYLSGWAVEQFEHVRAWFKSQTPPKNMLLLTPQGTFSLFDVQWSGHSENWGGRRTSIGTVRPTLTVLGDRDGTLADPLLMNEMHSRIDGLNEWVRSSAVDDSRVTDEAGRIQEVTLRLHADEGLTWRQGAATMTLRAGWLHSPEQDGYTRKTTIQDNVTLRSTFESGARPFWDHFVEQRKVANLMVFLFGHPLSFREHKLRDDRYAARLNDGEIYAYPLTEIVTRHTYRERRIDIPSKKDLGRPLAHMVQVGGEGLATWSDRYATWERFILPSVSVIGRKGGYLEDVVISTSMSIEAAGGILGRRQGEDVTYNGRGRPTTATYVYRCLDVLDVLWPERIRDRVGLARAIANNYNDVKHYDRGDFPEHSETYAVSEINQMIVRLLAIYITGRGDELLATFRAGNDLYHLQQVLNSYGLRVAEAGHWEHDPESEGEQETSNA
ncbi:ApeA N-terminal domain 1-containing protein [Agromyces aerolatus]|uniref:ApeA N-terminal domain 1-containing protein n=1 Tax=Agromyces sp. LY-1074 TaxID=3074080 RepID=UPI00285C413E|nr:MULTISPECIES: hypothetical protein [unclassified Agromyces]MDR5699962.1 hypothetical protein [Agromyces sp. LY-1074]MDR5706226.1 hypothetical protein [Agromyces sp. LY-1358]